MIEVCLAYGFRGANCCNVCLKNTENVNEIALYNDYGELMKVAHGWEECVSFIDDLKNGKYE